jgi:predicted RecA/RadA family phage recombinase
VAVRPEDRLRQRDDGLADEQVAEEVAALEEADADDIAVGAVLRLQVGSVKTRSTCSFSAATSSGARTPLIRT